MTFPISVEAQAAHPLGEIYQSGNLLQTYLTGLARAWIPEDYQRINAAVTQELRQTDQKADYQYQLSAENGQLAAQLSRQDPENPSQRQTAPYNYSSILEEIKSRGKVSNKHFVPLSLLHNCLGREFNTSVAKLSENPQYISLRSYIGDLYHTLDVMYSLFEKSKLLKLTKVVAENRAYIAKINDEITLPSFAQIARVAETLPRKKQKAVAALLVFALLTLLGQTVEQYGLPQIEGIGKGPQAPTVFAESPTSAATQVITTRQTIPSPSSSFTSSPIAATPSSTNLPIPTHPTQLSSISPSPPATSVLEGESRQELTQIKEQETKGTFKDVVAPLLEKIVVEGRTGKEHPINAGRINFLILGLGGETALTDSIQLMSWQPKSGNILVIGLPRDIHAPEVGVGKRINQVYALSRGDLAQVNQVIEHATALHPDFTILVKDWNFLADLVDHVFDGALEVDIPYNMKSLPFDKGTHSLSGEQVVALVRSRAEQSDYGRARMAKVVIEAMIRQHTSVSRKDPLKGVFMLKNAYDQLQAAIDDGVIKLDFDHDIVRTVGFKNLISAAAQLAANKVTGQTVALDIPQIEAGFVPDTYTNRTLVSGQNPANRYILQVAGGNPNSSDLEKDYWGPLREEVIDFVSQNTP